MALPLKGKYHSKGIVSVLFHRNLLSQLKSQAYHRSSINMRMNKEQIDENIND
jgi:hypothetical protein